MRYVDPTNTRVVILPKFPQGVRFDFIIVIIQLLNLKGVFSGSPTDDANMHHEFHKDLYFV